MIMFNNVDLYYMKINVIFKLSTRWHHLTYTCSLKMYRHTCNSLTSPVFLTWLRGCTCIYIRPSPNQCYVPLPPPLHLTHAVILIKRLGIIVTLHFSLIGFIIAPCIEYSHSHKIRSNKF